MCPGQRDAGSVKRLAGEESRSLACWDFPPPCLTRDGIKLIAPATFFSRLRRSICDRETVHWSAPHASTLHTNNGPQPSIQPNPSLGPRPARSNPTTNLALPQPPQPHGFSPLRVVPQGQARSSPNVYRETPFPHKPRRRSRQFSVWTSVSARIDPTFADAEKMRPLGAPHISDLIARRWGSPVRLLFSL